MTHIPLQYTAPSSHPLQLNVTNKAAGAVSISWLPPTPEHWNGEITGYVVTITDLNSFQREREMEIEIDTNVTSLIKRGLRTSRQYNFTVAAVTVKGRGPSSHPVYILTLFGGESLENIILDECLYIHRCCTCAIHMCGFELGMATSASPTMHSIISFTNTQNPIGTLTVFQFCV